jgi:hypothetical protein
MSLTDRRCPTSCLMVVVFALLMLPSIADAAASRLGGSFNASGTTGVGSKVTDIAYDPVNDVYLVVTGPEVFNGHVYGRFITGDGTPLASPFRVPQTTAPTQLPRVAYSAALGGFLVTWIDGRVNPKFCEVWGRFLKFSPGGAPVFTTNEVLIDAAAGGTQGDVPAPVACAGDKGECLVAWHQLGGGEGAMDIHAVRISLTGQRLGTEYFLTADHHWQTDPAIGYDPATGIYLVAHTFAPNASTSILVHRIQAESGVLHGASVLAEMGGLYEPFITLNTATGEFFITFYDKMTHTTYGRFMKPDGTFTSNIKPLLSGYTARDANGVAYNAHTGTFFAVTHGAGLEDIGYEISGTGVPSDVFQVTDFRGPDGAYYPRVAARAGRPEWMMTASAYFAFAGAQRVTTDTTGPGGPGQPGGPGGGSELIDLSPAGAPNGSWFLAEGVAQNTPNGFVTFYLVVNENNEPVNVRAYFSRDDGHTISRTFTVAANSRATLNLEKIGGVGTFGAVFQSLTPGLDVFVERSIYWGPNLEGSTAEVATRSLSVEWYFGEGSRDFFHNYFLLFNPNQVGGYATFTFYLEDGTIVYRHVTIGAQQRLTLDAMSVPELSGQNFGMRVTSTIPLVAERAMYFGLGATGFIGGTASVGSPGLARSWSFAEGAAAPGFHTFYLLMNPNDFPITVSRSFFLEDGSRLDGTVSINPGSRKTVYLNDEMGHIGGAAAQFASESPFIAERSIYWGAAGWVEGTNVIGSPVVAPDWHLPEGTEGGDFDSFLLILNPNAAPVTVDVIVYLEDLGRFTAPQSLRPVIAPNSRGTINMATFLTQMEQAGGLDPGTLSKASFSTRVRSTNGEDLVVEHALYRTFDGGNRWRSGSAAMGIPR